ncbi:YciI family protein [Amycolatopsis sp. NPDC005003]
MKFLMFVCTDSEPDDDRTDDIEAWVTSADSSGRRVLGSALAAPSDAVTIRVRKGELLRTTGPFADTKDTIVGFDILECADLEDAVDVVRAHPMARIGRIELRAFIDLD